MYVHYSPTLIDAVLSVEQSNEPHFKPNGFWISTEDDDGWKKWCEDNDYWGKIEQRAHDVALRDDARILHITSSDGIDDLTARYLSEKARKFSYSMVDWRKVAEEFQGVVIVPYFWSQRLSIKNQWYYAWDCASGCIWDADAIASIKVREEAPCSQT